MFKQSLIVIAALITVLGLMPEPQPDDNGDRSWAQQVVPELLGRKIRGWEETDVLGQAAELLGREKVTRAIMSDPDFVDHWSEILMDQIQVQRKGWSGNRDAIYDCWEQPLLSDHDRELARWVRTHNPDQTLAYPTTDPGSLPPKLGRDAAAEWNMNDLIRSALVLDDLGPVYLANLIPFEMNPGHNNDYRERGRARLGDEFDQVYLGRAQACMSCHNEQGSASDVAGWTRTFPHFPAVEAKVFKLEKDAGELEPEDGELDYGFGGASTVAAAHAAFNPHFRGGVFEDPWGIDLSCVTGIRATFVVTGLRTDEPNTPYDEKLEADDTVSAKLASVVGMDKSILDVEAALRGGIQGLTGKSLESHLLDESDDGGLSEDESLAYLLALNINNNIWEQIMGERLTIPHGYPRNQAQRDMLRFLTEEKFLPAGWSLRSVLEALLTSQWFNRSAPYVGNTEINGSPYHLPMILDPWLAEPPGEATEKQQEFNSQGRVVHRYAPRTLVRSAAAALGHTKLPPHLVPREGPEHNFAQGIGQYLNDYLPGTRSVDFVAMMTWYGKYGSCETPPDQGKDWLDLLTTDALTWDQQHPAELPLELRDVVLTLKDWLLGEATLDADLPANLETASVEEIFGGLSLDTPISDIGATALEDGARSYCGALVASPQFMLAGLRPADLGEGSRLRVCNPGDPCTWRETCAAWIGPLEEASGIQLACSRNKRIRTVFGNTINRPTLQGPRDQATDLGPPDVGSRPRDPGDFPKPPPRPWAQPRPGPDPLPQRLPARKAGFRR